MCLCGSRRLSDNIQEQLLVTIRKTFNYSRYQAQHILLMVTECMKKKPLVGQLGGLSLMKDKPKACWVTSSPTLR